MSLRNAHLYSGVLGCIGAVSAGCAAVYIGKVVGVWAKHLTDSCDRESKFQMTKQLSEGKHLVMSFPLSEVWLMDISCIPWLVLVPKRSNAIDMHDINVSDQMQLQRELMAASNAIAEIYLPTKINVGCLGNICPQLHIHVMGRFKTDPAWPGPAWGTIDGPQYAADELEATIKKLKRHLDMEAEKWQSSVFATCAIGYLLCFSAVCIRALSKKL